MDENIDSPDSVIVLSPSPSPPPPPNDIQICEDLEIISSDEGSDEDQQYTASHSAVKVFQNDMLREIILQKAIWPGDRSQPSRITVRSLRLVSKDFLQTVTGLFKNAKQSVFKLLLNNGNSSSNSFYCQENGGKTLNRFVTAQIESSRIFGYIPTFSLKLEPTFFHKENHADFANCLTKCGSGMLELQLEFPTNSSMVFIFQSFSLPKLAQLRVKFSEERIIIDNGVPGVSNLQNINHSIYPLQTILNAASNLNELQFLNVRSSVLIPMGFDCISIPNTVTKLLLDCPLKSSDLGILKTNQLSNVVHLRLFASEVPYTDGLICEILTKFRAHLVHLNLRGSQMPTRPRNTTLVSFPRMEALKVLTITSLCWDLEDDLDRPLNYHTKLPCLTELRLFNQSSQTFTKLTNECEYPDVSKLYISLTTQSVPMNVFQTYHEPLTLTLDKMQRLHMAFPFVTSLELTISGTDTCGLKYLFLEMHGLQKLAITVKSSTEYLGPTHWDALLIGTPNDMAYTFRRNPDFWNNIDLKDDNNFPSIRKLSQLRCLALVEHKFQGPLPMQPPSLAAEAQSPLISDMSFHFAFLRMPTLRVLLLSPRFMPSSTISDKWKKVKGSNILPISRLQVPNATV